MANIGSPFSPLWIDTEDASQRALDKLERGQISEDEFHLVSFFIANGYCIIEKAIDAALIDGYLAEVEKMFSTRPDLWVSEGPDIKRLGEAQVDRALTKVLDTYMVSRRALQMAFAPKLERMLKIIFGEAPAVHQGLHFQVGSTQAIHQDTAYVVVKPALALAAAWIALEDVKPGGGELIYYRGSHRFSDFIYPGEQRHWNKHRRARPRHPQPPFGLAAPRGRRARRAARIFLAKKRDTADLACRSRAWWRADRQQRLHAKEHRLSLLPGVGAAGLSR